MRFTILAFAPVPDVETARHNFDLHDLSDEAVAKVLFHRRKTHTGHSEALLWDQLRIAGVSLIHHSVDYFELRSHTQDGLSEAQMIGKVFDALSASGRLISWNCREFEQPLLHFRCMKQRICYAPYWQAIRDGQAVFTALHGLIDPSLNPDIGLDSLARRLGFPGMLGVTRESIWQASLGGDSQPLRSYADYRALNTYLLTLEALSMRGEISLADAARSRRGLREYLGRASQPQAHLKRFLDAWASQ